jgi:hypothetical protein
MQESPTPLSSQRRSEISTNYTSPFGRAIFAALANDPVWTMVVGDNRQPYTRTPWGYAVIEQPFKNVRVYIPDGPFTPEDTGTQSDIRDTTILSGKIGVLR